MQTEIGKEPSPESIDRELARAEGQKRRTRLILAGSALLAVVGVVVLQWAKTEERKRVLEAAWQEAAGCLLGGPLEAGERPSARVRGIKLALVGTEERRAYPERCADALATLHHTLVKEDKSSETATRAHALMKELREAKGNTNLSHVVDQLFAAAAAVGLTTDALGAPEEHAPPKPLRTWNVTSIGDSARLSEKALGPASVSSDRWPGAELNLLFQDKDGEQAPRLCTFDSAGPNVRCRSLTGKVAKAESLRLAGTHDRTAAPLLFGRAVSEDVVYRSDTGDEVARGNIQTGWIDAKGYVALATGPTDDELGTFALLEQHPDAALTRKELGPKTFGTTHVSGWAVAYGQLVVQAFDKIDDEEDESAEEEAKVPELHAVSLPSKGESPKFTAVGELDWLNAPWSFCASQSVLAMKVGSNRGYLLFFDGRGWSRPRFSDDLGVLVQCRDQEILLDRAGEVSVCGRDTCRREGLVDASFDGWDHVKARRAVLGDALVAVAESELRQGIRFVHGKGDVQLLFDDMMRRGEVQVNSTVSGTRIFSRANFAVALLFTDDGVFGIYFDKAGKPTPVAVAP